MTFATSPELERAAARCVLAVSVLEDLDVQVLEQGVVMPGPEPPLLPWAEVVDAATGGRVIPPPAIDVDQGADAEINPRLDWADDDGARTRVSALLRLRRLVADLGEDAPNVLRTHARLVALPSSHEMHLGAAWRHHSVLGGALDVGVGVVDLVGGRSDTVPLPPSVAREVGAYAWMQRLRSSAEEAAAILANRLRRDTVEPPGRSRFGQPRLPAAVMRPVAGVDVLSMLATQTIRAELTRSDPSGMRAVAVPMRTRGWYDTVRTDPAFVGAAWAATDIVNRGMPRTLLVTREEVGTGSGAPEVRIDLRDLDLAPEGSALGAVDRIRRRLRPDK